MKRPASAQAAYAVVLLDAIVVKVSDSLIACVDGAPSFAEAVTAAARM